MYYRFSSVYPASPTVRNDIATAAQELTQKTGFTFVEVAEAYQGNHVVINSVSGQGCSSHVGMVGGEQIVD
jgi:Astacin (Peptidase family M12A)